MEDKRKNKPYHKNFEPSTPLMKQYFSIKEKYNDAIVFFRLGDFYEMFGEDAEIASKVLQITLTTRDKGSENPLPMCGIPYFSAENYINRLISEGYKVAICEQIEDAEAAKGLVQREVVRVITPGTHEPENPKENSFILSLYYSDNCYGLAMAELSTGEFIMYESVDELANELSLVEPKEMLCPESYRNNMLYSELLKGYYVTYLDDWLFDYSEAYKTLLDAFQVSTLEGFGCEGMSSAISAGGALMEYLAETQKGTLGFNKISTLNKSSFMVLDSVTKKNLELLSNLKSGTVDESLLWVLDETLTAMGGRFLRDAIVKPLKESHAIQNRLDAVESLVNNLEELENLRRMLRNMQDMERLSIKLTTKRVSGRDLIAIKNSVSLTPRIKEIVSSFDDDLFAYIADQIEDFAELRDFIEKTIVDSPPHGIRDGGIIKRGYSEEVDELRTLSDNSREFLSKLEADERRNTGINSLKVGYNKVYGYYIEITKTNLHLVPDNYIRKQTLVNAERFVTPELKEYESKILTADEKLKKLEYHLLESIVHEIAVYSERLKSAASAIAMLDFLVSLATVARRHNYVKPSIDTTGKIEIIEGRHPVLERISRDERFIPNHTTIDIEDHFLLIITGPNMAGKSTYMRQTALIVLMAQLGSFVPASSARIGVVDKIFTRIGASDYLAKGQSTFMVEMVETANIINNATEKSLILLDEVGRGTSTFDGISIAWAVAEYITTRIKARTMFATHYNELTELSHTLEGIQNLNIAVKEWGDEIIFLRKIEHGPADKSYGIQVARLAGVPSEVLERAREVLENLEKDEINETGKPKFVGRGGKKKAEQLDLFGLKAHPVLTELNKVDLKSLSPGDAYKILLNLKELADNN